MSKIFEALRNAESSHAPQARMAVLAPCSGAGPDRRRSQRRVFDATVRVYGRRPSEDPFYEEARTINVSVHGALLLMTVPVELGQKLILINEVTQRQQICRIVKTRSLDTRQLEVSVEFPAPHAGFWENPPEHDGK